jgi:hypothetical protein
MFLVVFINNNCIKFEIQSSMFCICCCEFTLLMFLYSLMIACEKSKYADLGFISKYKLRLVDIFTGLTYCVLSVSSI